MEKKRIDVVKIFKIYLYIRYNIFLIIILQYVFIIN